MTEKLDTRILLEKSVSDTDELGGVIESWQTIGTVWANVRYLKGRELVEAKQLSGEAQAVFTIRYSSDVAGLCASDRITLRGQVYAIVAPPLPIPGGRPEKLQIFTKLNTC